MSRPDTVRWGIVGTGAIATRLVAALRSTPRARGVVRSPVGETMSLWERDTEPSRRTAKVANDLCDRGPYVGRSAIETDRRNVATTLPASRDTARLTAFTTLQELLQQLTTLSETAQQAHGSVSGRSFLAVHALTEQIAASARLLADRVARRAEALGSALDDRPTIAACAPSPLPAGPLGDAEAIVALGALVGVVARTARCSLEALDEGDAAVAYGITVEVLEALEKYRWMLCAQSG